MDPVIDYSKTMLKDGLTFGTGGNISRRLSPETYLITPSGQAYESLEDKDLVEMEVGGEKKPGQNPSSEYHLHSLIYEKYSQAQAIVHTHSNYINVLAALERPLPTMHYLMASAGPDPIQVASYASFGTQDLAREACKAFGRNKAVILSHHGLVAYGANLKEAYDLAKTLEFCTFVYVQASALGPVKNLPKEEMERMVLAFQDYGVRKKLD